QLCTHMKKKIVVLGAGLVGKTIAADLARDFEVTSADINDEALNAMQQRGVRTLKVDLNDTAALQSLVEPFDLVVGAVPGFMGFRTVAAVIEAGKSMVDISFFPEDPFELDARAKEKGVTIVTDSGVAPGMGNIIRGYHHNRMKAEHY